MSWSYFKNDGTRKGGPGRWKFFTSTGLEKATNNSTSGTLANRPSISTVPNDTAYFATDDTGGTLYRAIGGSWVKQAPGVTSVPTYTYSASKPSSPANGDRWCYPADSSNSVIWDFRYSTTNSRWEFVGGSPLHVGVETQESVGDDGAFHDLTTVGPQYTTPFAGDWNVQGGAIGGHGSYTNNVELGLKWGASYTTQVDAVVVTPIGGTFTTLLTPVRSWGATLSASTVIKLQYEVDTHAIANDYVGNFRFRWINIIPRWVS